MSGTQGKRRRGKGWDWYLEAAKAFTPSGHFRMLPGSGRGPPGRAKDFNSWCFSFSREPGEREGTWFAWTLSMGELSQGNQGLKVCPSMPLGPWYTATLRRVGSWGSGLIKTHRVCMWEPPGRMFKKWIAVAFYSWHLFNSYIRCQAPYTCFRLRWRTLIVHGKIQFKKPLGVGIISFYREVTLV